MNEHTEWQVQIGPTITITPYGETLIRDSNYQHIGTINHSKTQLIFVGLVEESAKAFIKIINKMYKKPYATIEFFNLDKQIVGVLDFNNAEVIFTGIADSKMRDFIDMVNRIFKEDNQ